VRHLCLSADASLKSEDLLTKHVEAIGSAEARTSAWTRMVQGGAVYRILVGGGGRPEGKTRVVRAKSKSVVLGQASGH